MQKILPLMRSRHLFIIPKFQGWLLRGEAGTVVYLTVVYSSSSQDTFNTVLMVQLDLWAKRGRSGEKKRNCGMNYRRLGCKWEDVWSSKGEHGNMQNTHILTQLLSASFEDMLMEPPRQTDRQTDPLTDRGGGPHRSLPHTHSRAAHKKNSPRPNWGCYCLPPAGCQGQGITMPPSFFFFFQRKWFLFPGASGLVFVSFFSFQL